MLRRTMYREEANIEPYTPTAVQGSVPGTFRQVFRWSIKENPVHTLVTQLMTVPLCILGCFAFSYLGRVAESLHATGQIGVLEMTAGVAGCATTIILHEFVHGQTMRLFGAKPRYGALLTHFLFYATAPGYAFQRNAYVLVALAPLVVLSCLAVGGMMLLQGTAWVLLLAFCATMNLAGAWGDVWMMSQVLRYPSTAYVVDERDGFRVLLRQE